MRLILISAVLAASPLVAKDLDYATCTEILHTTVQTKWSLDATFAEQFKAFELPVTDAMLLPLGANLKAIKGIDQNLDDYIKVVTATCESLR